MTAIATRLAAGDSLAGKRVLVLDAQERASLAVVRSLVKAGCTVLAASTRRWSLGGAARDAIPVRVYANSLLDPRAHAKEIAALSSQLGVHVVLPISDASVESMLEHRGQLPPGVVLPFAPLSVYRAASDKLRVHELALQTGLGIEETVVVKRAGDAAPADSALYPGVVKPHRSVVGGATRIKLSVSQVASREACARVLDGLPPEAFPVLVQRRVRGPGEGFFSARWNRVTLATFAHRRLREKPPSGGVSVFRESIAMDPIFGAACDALLDQLAWDGVAMVECKRDLDRGGWRLMEINGRFWGSLQLAIDAGVPFPPLLVRAALGLPVSAAPPWRAGVRLRWEWGDVDHLLLRLLRSPSLQQLPPDAPTRLGAIRAFFGLSPATDRLEVLRISDPIPFLVETLERIGISR